MATRATPDYLVARATAPGHNQVIGMNTAAALRHLWVLGPPGVGKSVLLSNLVLQTIASGKGAVFIEPKGDAIEDVIGRLPAHRREDVVILDPTDPRPVGLNPLAGGQPDVRTEGLLEIFVSLFGDAIGPRSRDILHSSILSLARRGDASLPMLPLLLTHPGFRRSVTQHVVKDDPLALGAFWAWYEQLSDGERSAAIAPVLNKVRAFTTNRYLRGVLGQRRPVFDMWHVFEQGTILLVPLRSGVIGDSAAKLLGSLVVAELFQAAMARAAISASRRQPAIVTIDELHQYVHVGDFAEALALFRGYGVGLQLANQHIGQLPRNLREAMLGTVRSRVVFQTNHRDAAELSKGHPELSADDFTSLGAYEVYASLVDHNTATPYVSGKTLPLGPPTTDTAAVRQASRHRYGQALDDVEAGLTTLITTPLGGGDVPSGRKRRQI